MASTGSWTKCIQVLYTDSIRTFVMLTGQSIFVPESPFLFELSKDGDKANGTPVVIEFENRTEAQQWRFEKV